MSQTANTFNGASATWEEHRAAFFKALTNSDKTTLETVLVKYPEAVEWTDTKGNTPLHTAFDKRDNDLFIYLLNKGASPDQQAQLTGLRKVFADYDDPSVLEKAIKAGEKAYIIPLLQYGASGDSYRTSGSRAPKAIRFEIEDLLKRRTKIRQEFLDAQKQQAKSSPPQPAATTNTDNTDVEILRPLQLKNRTPNATA